MFEQEGGDNACGGIFLRLELHPGWQPIIVIAAALIWSFCVLSCVLKHRLQTERERRISDRLSAKQAGGPGGGSGSGQPKS